MCRALSAPAGRSRSRTARRCAPGCASWARMNSTVTRRLLSWFARERRELPWRKEPRALPGFGPYTAAAVASLAFHEDVPLVDGNVARVLARVFRIEEDARAKAWEIAARLLPRGRAAEFNEALMELGATVCTPRAP